MKALEKINKRIEDLQTELKKLEIIQKMDLDIPEAESIVVGGHLAAYAFIYNVYSLEDVKSIISTVWNSKKVDILPLSMCKDGMTVSFLTPYHGRRGEITNVFPITVNVSKYDLGFAFYGLAEDKILRFVIKIPEVFHLYARVSYRQKGKYGVVHGARLEHPYFKNPSVISWAAGDRHSVPSYTMCWTNANSLDQIFED